MKNSKSGFTFIELMFVMLLLALLAIISYPYVINSYNKSDKKTFLIEAKNIYTKSEAKFASELLKGNKLYTITESDPKSSLNYGEGVIKYCVNLASDGKVTSIKVAKANYYAEGNVNFLDEIKLETVKYGEFYDKFSCDYVFDENDLRPEPTLKEIRAEEGYLKAIKYLGISFVVVIIIGLFVSTRNRRTGI